MKALIDYSVQSKSGSEQILKLFGKLSDFQKENKSKSASAKPKSKKKKADIAAADSDDGNDNKPQKKKGPSKTKKTKETEPLLLSLASCTDLMTLMCGSNEQTV